VSHGPGRARSSRTRGALPPSTVTDLVRRGWDQVSWTYRAADRGGDSFGHTALDYRGWLAPLVRTLPPASRVLDLGCGTGEPAARYLARRFRVTGVDLSAVQLARARRAVPSGRFLRADMTRIRFPPRTFDAVVALYSIIHVPVARPSGLFRRTRRWLRPKGWFVGVLGHTAWTGREPDWLGGPGEMYWSHADAATYRRWLRESGFRILRQEFVPEGEGGHELFVARRDP
jgi:SAM-dependent methyltransferase